MRKIELFEPDTDEWRAWRTKCAQQTDKLIRSFGKTGKVDVSDLYKAQKDYFRRNAAPFYGICAYCEQYIIGDQWGDIEHFRPKKAVVTDAGKKLSKVSEVL